MRPPRILVFGYGNPGRQDDGLGPAAAALLEAMALEGVTADSNYQLNIEDAAALAEHDIALFIDASVDGPAPYRLRRIAAAPEIAFTTHSVSAESVLAICEDSFHVSPEAWILGIRGYSFDFLEGLTPDARRNLEAAVEYIPSLIRTWRERTMDSGNTPKKVILAIDDDPDIRSSLRLFLEAAGFTVGEAINGEEGLKVAERIQPDAVIVDLMMESVDSGAIVARKLKDAGYAGPVWMLSSAGDAVAYNLDARELGLAGIFQKPINPKTLVATLKSKLQVV